MSRCSVNLTRTITLPPRQSFFYGPQCFHWHAFSKTLASKATPEDVEKIDAAYVRQIANGFCEVNHLTLVNAAAKLEGILGESLENEVGRCVKKPSPAPADPRMLPAATANDARDKWLYEQCCKLVAYSAIIRALAEKETVGSDRIHPRHQAGREPIRRRSQFGADSVRQPGRPTHATK